MEKVQKIPRYSKINGIIYPEMFSSKCFKEALQYKPKPGDVFICSYPKCGTTWMQILVLLIFRKSQKLNNPSDFRQLAPYIDLLGQESIDKMPRPGAFKTHIPYSQMPYSKDAKYIFVTRNPKDCCVSLYYHTIHQPGFEYWDDGEVIFNDYFDHLLDWYPHRYDTNVYFTTYEDMKKDVQSVILSLSKFLGKEYMDAIEKDNTVLRNIKYFSQFDYVKETFSNLYIIKRDGNTENMYEGLKYRRDFVASLDIPKNLPELQFMRKGIIGDWKNHFSPEQTERLKRKFLLKLKDTDVLQWFPEE